MKKLIVLLAAVALLVGGVVVLQAQDEMAATDKPAPAEKAWFDMVNCGFCKHLTAEEGLLQHSTWENFIIPTGMISVSTVEPGYEEKMKNAMHNMEETGMKMMAGETVPMCGMCQSFGMIMATGKAEWKDIDTKAGHLQIMTSTDPEVITMIQEHAQRTIDEYAKMEAAEQPKDK